MSDFAEADFIPTNYIFDREGNLQMTTTSGEKSPLGKDDLEELLQLLL